MIIIYHNPRCSKSRAGVEYLENKGVKFDVVKYLDENLTENELKNLIKKLGIKPIDLIRKNEAIWKEYYKSKNLSDEEIINAMLENPTLIERPIIVNGDKAVIARPIERIDEVL